MQSALCKNFRWRREGAWDWGWTDEKGVERVRADE